ncbi:MAG TPA: 3-deoxy-D-manno-octulosonic acid transferase [Flavobacteriaceae bacterium]|jgi:3-deoxy-D-manno-octulosonic-acid transferase|nr:3-deoxy-D-manno-octulosonic acid transferase [Flavobacteriaceae bacterium]
MYFFYNIAIIIAGFILKIIAPFNKKIKLFIDGRKGVFKTLSNHFNPTDKIIWFHCASLGEFEQGRPILEKCKTEYPNHKILVTFFSPSGYEIRKNHALADVVCYLPLDTKQNAKKFLSLAHPEIAIMVKYEFWPNLLRELKLKEIKTILVSGIFRDKQSFFQWYGGWMRKSLKTFDHFFVQNETSKKLLKKIGFTKTTLSGDTRFDRVYEVTQQDIDFDFAAQFTKNKTTLIAGSTWQKDEELLVNYINNNATEQLRFIIAPHNIHQQSIEKLKQNISKKAILFSEIKDQNLEPYQVLIIDTIGILTQIYKYADIAYVGGGFGTGIHNILEPATFGVPIVIGPNYQKFNEAVALVNLKACVVIHNPSELKTILNTLFNTTSERENKGQIAKDYILKNIGATKMVMGYLNKNIPKK